MANDADDLDRAADLTRALADAQIGAVRALARPEQVQRPDGSWPVEECLDCGDDLGERLKLAKVRCVACQGLKERRSGAWPR